MGGTVGVCWAWKGLAFVEDTGHTDPFKGYPPRYHFFALVFPLLEESHVEKYEGE